MRKFPLLLLILSGALVLSSCSHQSQNIQSDNEAQKLVGDFKVKRVVFKNGLRLLVLEDDSSPTFAYQTWFTVGSRNESPGKTGLAHLFEHMMFKGTQKYPDGKFDSLLEQAGVEGENAFTSNDHTVYIQELPKEQLDLIIELESDRMNNLIVDDKSFSTEREVVQNERRFRKENSAEGTIYQSLFEIAFQSGAYHWPVIGYEQDLNIMNAQDARDFYQSYYSPDRATIVVVGDVDTNEVIRKVEKAYAHLPARYTSDSSIPKEPEQTAQRRKKLPLNIQSEKLWMAFKIPEDQHPDTPALRLLESILTDGMNSRLNRALVNSGIASKVGCGSFTLRDPGLFVFVVDLQKGKSASLAESIVLRELDQLKNKLVASDELQRAKNVNRYLFFQKLATASGKANFLGESESTYGNHQIGMRMQDEVTSLDSEKINQVVKKYFSTQKMTVITGVPKQ